MNRQGGFPGLIIAVATIAPPCLAANAAAQGPAVKAAPAAESVEAIDREFRREVVVLERERLRRLAELAARQPKAEAEKTYEVYLRSAAGRELYQEAEPVAEGLLKAGDTPPRVRYLASVVKILAQVRRGDYDGSLASVELACRSTRDQPGDGRGASPLLLPERLALIEIYYQALIQADQFEVARRALAAIRDVSREDAARQYLDRHLARIALHGAPAPAIEGTDLDGQPFRLSDQKGNVVLLVFWASWNTPNLQEAGRLKELERSYRDRGLRIVGINLDALQEGSGGADAVLPQVRRFLVEQNISWPILVEGKGGDGYARAYGVSEIPANFLIGRDGRVVTFDLAPALLEPTLAKALGR